VQTFPESHDVAAVLLIVTAIASPVLEGAVTAFERAGSAQQGRRARAIGNAFLETTILRTGRERESDRGTKWVLVGSVLAAIFLGWRAASAFPGADMPGRGWLTFAFGLVLIWCGIALRVWSIATLGRFFRRIVVVQEGHRIVSSGPYRLVRHPAYLGNLLATAGLGLALGNWASLAILTVLPALGHVPRIRVEEGALEETLGADYASYAASRKRLVPGVW
jgi:protein-S-isoprenylcysteine O-methyltransferase Ste14